MLQHQHILLTLIFLLPFLDTSSPLAAFLSISIVLIFSVLPDIDLSGKKFTNSSLSYGKLKGYFLFLSKITELIRLMIFIPYDFIVRLLIRKSNSYHRETSHSVIFGLVSIAVITFLITSIFSVYNQKIQIPEQYIWLAALAFLIHLYLDSLTVKGIQWFYPLRILEIKGRLDTSNTVHMNLIDVYIFIIIFFSGITLINTYFPSIHLSIYEYLAFWKLIFPDHTYLLSIPLLLFLREVKLSL